MLPLVGQQVTRCCFDFAEVSVLFANGISVNIGDVFVYADSGGREFRLDPEGEASRLAPVLALLRMNAVAGFAFSDGRLSLDFEDGSRIKIPASEQFEARNITGPDGLRIVSMPGGELAIWS